MTPEHILAINSQLLAAQVMIADTLENALRVDGETIPWTFRESIFAAIADLEVARGVIGAGQISFSNNGVTIRPRPLSELRAVAEDSGERLSGRVSRLLEIATRGDKAVEAIQTDGGWWVPAPLGQLVRVESNTKTKGDNECCERLNHLGS